jgi:hypothetical protein
VVNLAYAVAALHGHAWVSLMAARLLAELSAGQG